MPKYPLSSDDINSGADDIKARYEMALEQQKDMLKTNKAHRESLKDGAKLQKATLAMLEQILARIKAKDA